MSINICIFDGLILDDMEFIYKTKWIAFLLFILLMIGCQSSNDENSVEELESRIQLRLVDAPGDYLEVNVIINDIRYNPSDDDEGWISFGEPDDYPIEVDLTELIAGNDLLLMDEIIPSGEIKQIRLVLGEGNTLVIEDDNGEPFTVPLNTPSAQQSGLKLHLDTFLEPGFTYVYILDWDVNESIVQAGSSGNYNLHPVINLIAQVNSGSISGIVMDDLIPLQDIVVQAYTGNNEYVTSTITNNLGEFLVSGLVEGEYILKIEEMGYEPYESPENVNVINGAIADAGIILLIPL